MANKTLFKSAKTAAPAHDTTNWGGGRAYELSAKHALAQIAMTGTFNGTFYAKPEDILDIAKKAAQGCADDPAYIAKVAIAARESGYMKDMPAFLVAMLAELDTGLFRKVFNRVIDNGKMLRNVIQMARSGQLGKRRNISAGTYRHAIRDWFRAHSPLSIWKASIGNEPSMKVILRLAHPKPESDAKAALYAYLGGQELDEQRYQTLPTLIREYEEYKRTKRGPVPAVDWRFLDSMNLDRDGWIQVAKNANWFMTMRNLNTFTRHGALQDKEAAKIVAARLSDEHAIRNARVFPYQIMTAWKAAGQNVPFIVREALQDAMEIATSNVPKIDGKIYICVDVSGSMRWGITGRTKNGYGGWNLEPNVPRCVDVAALFAASMMRVNRDCELLVFSNVIHPVSLNPRDTVLTNADALASVHGGGTNCSAPLAYLNKNKKTGDAVVFVSDYESWIDTPPQPGRYSDGTKMHQEWLEFKQRNRKAKLICIDLTPRDNSQVKDRADILQVGGFSDQVFEVISGYMGANDPDYWVHRIEQIQIDTV